MFKKTEESEWTRFSRALGNRDEARESEPTPDVAEVDPAEGQPTMVTPPHSPEPANAVEFQRAPTIEPATESRAPEPMVAPPPPPPPSPEPIAPPPPMPVAPPTPQPMMTSGKPAAVSATDTMLQDDVLDDEAEVESTIGDGMLIEGNIKSPHSIRILGSVQGEIESKGKVTIETDATVNAKISAELISIRGVVNGELTCPGRIEITDTGRLIGGINGGILVMHDGAYFEGTLKMTARRTQSEPAADPERTAREGTLNEEPL